MSEVFSIIVGETIVSELCDGLFVRICVIDSEHACLDFINDYGSVQHNIPEGFIIKDITNPDEIIDVKTSYSIDAKMPYSIAVMNKHQSFTLLSTNQYEFSFRKIWVKLFHRQEWEIQGVQEWRND
jgi:hypothetical protein